MGAKAHVAQPVTRHQLPHQATHQHPPLFGHWPTTCGQQSRPTHTKHASSAISRTTRNLQPHPRRRGLPATSNIAAAAYAVRPVGGSALHTPGALFNQQCITNSRGARRPEPPQRPSTRLPATTRPPLPAQATATNRVAQGAASPSHDAAARAPASPRIRPPSPEPCCRGTTACLHRRARDHAPAQQRVDPPSPKSCRLRSCPCRRNQAITRA